ALEVAVLIAYLRRDDHHAVHADQRQEVAPRLGELDLHGRRVRRVDAADEAHHADEVGRLPVVVEAELDVAGGQVAAVYRRHVLELDPRPQLERPFGAILGGRPALGQVADDLDL